MDPYSLDHIILISLPWISPILKSCQQNTGRSSDPLTDHKVSTFLEFHLTEKLI